MFMVLRKVSKPVPHQFKPFVLDSVNAHAASLFMREQARPFEHTKVPCSRLPRVLENGSYFARSHGAAVEIDRKQNSSPGSVRQGSEY